MKKRTFLKISSTLMAGSIISPLMRCKPEPKYRNWAGNLEYGTSVLYEPTTEEEVRELVLKTPKLRVLGTRHSFSSIADSNESLLSTKGLDKIYSLDKGKNSVTVGAGIQYGKLAVYLESNGYALHNLASLPHISVGGACATGTHGSGIKNGNLSSAVSAMEIITANGETLVVDRTKDADLFNAAVVGLGALGVVTKMTLDVQPSYRVCQEVYLDLPMQELEMKFDAIMGSGYSVSLFTDWQSDNINQVWIKSITNVVEKPSASEFFGSKLATRDVHPIIEISAENCTEQMGIAGPWHERLPHFKMGFTPSSGEELQAEYFVPRDRAFEAITAVAELHEELKAVIQITEIRTIAADSLWMSPCYQRDSVAIHFTLKPDKEGVGKVLPLIEKKLEPFKPRPHWAKLFTISPAQLQASYEKLPDFRKLMTRLDPEGKFVNEFIRQNLGV